MRWARRSSNWMGCWPPWLAQRRVLDGRDEALHPAVLLARRRGIEVDEAPGGAGDLLPLLLVFGAGVVDGDDLPVLQIEVGAVVGGVVLEGGFEGRPVGDWRVGGHSHG